MSALNDSCNISGRPLPSGRQYRHPRLGTLPSILDDGVASNPASGKDGPCGCETGFDRSGIMQSEDEDALQSGSPPEQQLSFLQRAVRRHESQIACLLSGRHQHCEHLATVYEELEKVLQKIQIAPLQKTKGLAASSSSGVPLSTASSDDDGYAVSSSAPAPTSSPHQNFDNALRQHKDRVYDVLLDYRQQIDKHQREMERRLCVIEDAMSQLQSDIRELHRTSSAPSAELRRFQQDIRQHIEAVATQQEALRLSLEVSGESRDTNTTKLIRKIQEDVARLCADTKAMGTHQVQSDKECEQQLRSLSVAQQRLQQEMEVHSTSIVELKNQNSLEGAFHELKDWLGDLEKRMVSRGELLQWTESLQSEVRQMRRVVGGSHASLSDSAAPCQDP